MPDALRAACDKRRVWRAGVRQGAISVRAGLTGSSVFFPVISPLAAYTVSLLLL